MASKVKHTYGSRKSSINGSYISSEPYSLKRKRPLQEYSNSTLAGPQPPLKRAKALSKTKTSAKENQPQKFLTQLHFCIDQPVLRECPRCCLSYTKGAPDDENLHRVHCSRIQKGMEWGKEEEKEAAKSSIVQVANNVRLKTRSKGRIICFKAGVGGKVGSKLNSLLETINLTLSSPPLSPESLRESKVYLFLLQSATPSSREKIAGCVIAQRISTAMAIASPVENEGTAHDLTTNVKDLIAVDSTKGVFCHPKPLPTPLGISRLFVPSTHRRQGIARHLLTAAANTFIHGCPLDPRKGEVAFTQPTGDGSAVMINWGEGGVRIYEE